MKDDGAVPGRDALAPRPCEGISGCAHLAVLLWQVASAAWTQFWTLLKGCRQTASRSDRNQGLVFEEQGTGRV